MRHSVLVCWVVLLGCNLLLACSGAVESGSGDETDQQAVASELRRWRWPRPRDAGVPQAGSGGSTSGSAGTGQAGMGQAGMGGTTGTGGTGGSGSAGTPSGTCFAATRLWFDDFETGDYRRWTSQTYNTNWGNDCQSNALSTQTAHSPSHSQRSQITCAYTAEGNVQRGYGGLQFSGDSVVPAYTNKGVGIDAPNGVVTTMWTRLDSPTVFQNGKWLSLWTASGSCDWSDEVLTLGIEDSSGRLAAAHYDGSRTFASNAALPRGQWVRITVYVNYYSGVMHVWQDGVSQEHVTFHRDLHTICQWHWGLYASGNNDNIVLFEDDHSLWKLNQAWTDWNTEPYFDHGVSVCAAN